MSQFSKFLPIRHYNFGNENKSMFELDEKYL